MTPLFLLGLPIWIAGMILLVSGIPYGFGFGLTMLFMGSTIMMIAIETKPTIVNRKLEEIE